MRKRNVLRASRLVLKFECVIARNYLRRHPVFELNYGSPRSARSFLLLLSERDLSRLVQ